MFEMRELQYCLPHTLDLFGRKSINAPGPLIVQVSHGPKHKNKACGIWLSFGLLDNQHALKFRMVKDFVFPQYADIVSSRTHISIRELLCYKYCRNYHAKYPGLTSRASCAQPISAPPCLVDLTSSMPRHQNTSFNRCHRASARRCDLWPHHGRYDALRSDGPAAHQMWPSNMNPSGSSSAAQTPLASTPYAPCTNCNNPARTRSRA